MTYFEDRMAEIGATASAMMLKASKKRLRYVNSETTRHGRKVFYLRRPGHQRIRLPDPDKVGSVAFNQAYQAAMRGERITPEPVKRLRPLTGEIGKPGYVYFLTMGEFVKIGFSTSVGRRLQSIRTACPEPATVAKIIPGSDQTERYFHAHFGAYRQSGEWFRLEGALAAFLAVQVGEFPALPVPAQGRG